MTAQLSDLTGSAYAAGERVSKHFTGVRLFGPVFVSQARQVDPLGFSGERWLAGETDVDAGRTFSLDEAMNVLRTQVRPDGA